MKAKSEYLKFNICVISNIKPKTTTSTNKTVTKDNQRFIFLSFNSLTFSNEKISSLNTIINFKFYA